MRHLLVTGCIATLVLGVRMALADPQNIGSMVGPLESVVETSALPTRSRPLDLAPGTLSIQPPGVATPATGSKSVTYTFTVSSTMPGPNDAVYLISQVGAAVTPPYLVPGTEGPNWNCTSQGCSVSVAQNLPAGTAVGSWILQLQDSTNLSGPPRSSSTTLTVFPPIQNVFVILMENNNWSNITSVAAPYIHSLLTVGAHAENYMNPPGLHPSEPNYLWLEEGGPVETWAFDDGAPRPGHSTSNTNHLVTLLGNAGVSWKSYQEDISSNPVTCPLSPVNNYHPRHNPFVYFNDITNNNDPNSAACIQHIRPYGELASDLANNNIARYNFITPNLCYDMHDCGIAAGDNWLKAEVPNILNSQAFKNGGALFITWDEGVASTGAQSDGPIGMIMLSPYAKQGYSNQTYYTHSSTLKTMQELFGVFAPAPAAPLIGNDTAGATDLVDFFTTTPTAVPAPLSGTLTGMLSIIAPGGQP